MRLWRVMWAHRVRREGRRIFARCQKNIDVNADPIFKYWARSILDWCKVEKWKFGRVL